MATRRLYQFGGEFYPKMCEISGLIFFGAGGQIKNGVGGLPATTTDGYNAADGLPLDLPRGLASVVHNGTGDYTFTLQDFWDDLHAVQLTVGAVAAVAGSGVALDLESEFYSYNVRASTETSDSVVGPAINVLFFTPGGTTKVDPPSGSSLSFTFKLRNSARGT